MGLSFHYSGKIHSNTAIEKLILEVEDICKSLNWKYHIWERKSSGNWSAKKDPDSFAKYRPDDVKGISLMPAECEPLFLTFLPDGSLCSPLKLMVYNPVNDDLMIEVIHTKTQFAGPDIHVTLMELLHYLKDKYFSMLKVDDEGMYWGKWDKEILMKQFAKYNIILEIVTDALSDFKAKPGESAFSLSKRLEELLLNRFINKSVD